MVIPFEGGYGFKMIGGNAVGLFVSEVWHPRKNIAQGDQILEINGTDARHMTHYEATQLLRSSQGPLSLIVMENNARKCHTLCCYGYIRCDSINTCVPSAGFVIIRDQFEFDSFYLRCKFDHSPPDPKDMKLQRGSLLHVVNTILFGGQHWLAWSVNKQGMDTELRRIPSPSRYVGVWGCDCV